jgi:hypothetical protein
MSIQVARCCSLFIGQSVTRATHAIVPSQNPNCSTSNQFVSTSFELFITDPRNVFGAGSSFEYRNVGSPSFSVLIVSVVGSV